MENKRFIGIAFGILLMTLGILLMSIGLQEEQDDYYTNWLYHTQLYQNFSNDDGECEECKWGTYELVGGQDAPEGYNTTGGIGGSFTMIGGDGGARNLSDIGDGGSLIIIDMTDAWAAVERGDLISEEFNEIGLERERIQELRNRDDSASGTFNRSNANVGGKQ